MSKETISEKTTLRIMLQTDTLPKSPTPTAFTPSTNVSHKHERGSKNLPISLRVLTHNIRYATSSPFEGEEPWSVRRPYLTSELNFNSTNPITFVCLQEVLHSQLLNIHADLNDGAAAEETWSYVGVGRDDGKHAGEYAPIFYRPLTCKLESWKTVWLSETPHVPSKGWDAASVRIVTIAVFEIVGTATKVVILNTHLDDQGVVSRCEAAKMILQLITDQELSEGKGLAIPVILAGDFNSPPEGEAYQVITTGNNKRHDNLLDVGDLLPQSKRYGNTLTYTSFGHVDPVPSRIDFLFINKHHNLLPSTHAVLANRFDDGVYSSDHRAVVADFMLHSDGNSPS